MNLGINISNRFSDINTLNAFCGKYEFYEQSVTQNVLSAKMRVIFI